MKEITAVLSPLILFCAVFSPSSKYASHAFPNGAGHCSGGTAISNESHGTTGSGSLGEGKYQVTFQETGNGNSEWKALSPGPPQFLSTGIEYTIKLSATDSANGGFFRGFLFRLSGKQGENVKDAMQISSDYISIGKNHTMCSTTVAGVTHSSNVEKNNVAVSLKFDEPIQQVALEVTVVRSNNPTGSNLWHYNAYNLVVSAPATPSKTPTVNACADDSTFLFKLDIGNIQDCAWLTRNDGATNERIRTYCSRPHVRYACPATCLELQGQPCECMGDNPGYIFELENADITQSCDWLTRNDRKISSRQDSYCLVLDKTKTSEVGENCIKSCGFCRGGYPLPVPSAAPTDDPSTSPSTISSSPSEISDKPSEEPSHTPTQAPSTFPSSAVPSNIPTVALSVSPSGSTMPTLDPSESPTMLPSTLPSLKPTIYPSTVPSNAPSFIPSSKPSSQPSTTCHDDSTFLFKLDIGNIQDCAWLTRNDGATNERIQTYCSRPHIRYACPATCLELQGQPCECMGDNPGYIFELENVDITQSCDWLTRNFQKMSSRHDSYCLVPDKTKTSEVGENCIKSCGFCRGSYPLPVPSATPTDDPSLAPTVSLSPSEISDKPSVEPSNAPTQAPSTIPTVALSLNPSGSTMPTLYPSESPTMFPSTLPSLKPTMHPSTVPSNAPSISHKPSVHPSVACADDPTFQFELDKGNVRDCEWLMSNSEKSFTRIETYCSRPHIRYACPATCLELQGYPCECEADKPGYTFELQNVGIKQPCDWLTRNLANMNSRQKDYCFMESSSEIVSNVGKNCITSCGFCKGIFPSIDVKPWVQLGTDIIGEIYYDEFGASVSISGDGMTIAVGAPHHDANGSDSSGVVRIFKWNTTESTWKQLGQDIDGQSVGDVMGRSVSLSKDGRTVAIGAPNDDTSNIGSFTRGRVRVFVYEDDELMAWRQLGEDINGENDSDVSGSCVSLSDDGRTVAIGAPFNNGSGDKRGHVRVFKYDASDTVWKQLGQDIDGESDMDVSGWSVSLSGDGQSVAIGAPSNNDGNDALYYKGHVRVFKWNKADVMWQQVGADIDGESYYDESGSSVSLSDDGRIVAVGSPFNNGGDYYNGSVRVFKFDDANNVWAQLGPDINGELYYELSGWSVSLSGDGQVVAIGAPFNKDVNYYYQGRVRVFRWNENKGVWKQVGGDIDGESYYDQSGSSVSLSDDGRILAVGAPWNRRNGEVEARGNVRVFRAP